MSNLVDSLIKLKLAMINRYLEDVLVKVFGDFLIGDNLCVKEIILKIYIIYIRIN